jgi:putative phosphoesterase
MRLGLIADIHGNLVALDAVLAALAAARVDEVVCLGDVAALGPQPSEVISRLREIGCQTVLGNTDAWLLPDPQLPATPPTSTAVSELTRWCADQLSNADRRALSELPVELTLSLATTHLYCFHASPRSLDDVIAATTPDADLAAMLGERAAPLVAGGHTHIQLLRRWGEAFVLNPGSVGLPGVGPGDPRLPVNRDVHWAEFAIVDVSARGTSIDLRRLPLDLDRVLAAVVESGMPHRDWWAGLWGIGRGRGRSRPRPRF